MQSGSYLLSGGVQTHSGSVEICHDGCAWCNRRAHKVTGASPGGGLHEGAFDTFLRPGGSKSAYLHAQNPHSKRGTGQIALCWLRQVACGNDFTLWLCKQRIWSAGNPQYGQLGHGTDHEYNAKDSAPPAPQFALKLFVGRYWGIMYHSHCLDWAASQII